MICQPDAIIRLPELMAVFVHLACGDPQHHGLAMPLADTRGSLRVTRKMHMPTPTRTDPYCPDIIKIGTGGAVEQLFRWCDDRQI